LFSIEFSDYGTTIVAYTLFAVLLLKVTATFRRPDFNFLKRPLHFEKDCFTSKTDSLQLLKRSIHSNF